MNYHKKLKHSLALFLLTLLAATALLPSLRAQSGSQRVDSRYLFIFDTSSAMKKRVPAEEKAITELFGLELQGQLHGGDSVGAWTFSQQMQMGEFPLEYWEPGELSATSAQLENFVKSRHYARTTSFVQLMPELDVVMRNSQRLTTMIFCDGDGQISGTPIDEKINSLFKENYTEMKKSRQPFIIILRSQFGHYVSFSINTPGSITLTPFPPLPPPPAPVITTPPPPPPAPAPFIIIGTNVSDKLPPATPPPVVVPQPTPAPAPSASAPAPAPTSPPANQSSQNSAPQNHVMQPASVSMPAPSTNTVVAAPETATLPPPPPTSETVPPPAQLPQTEPAPNNRHWLAVGVIVVVLVGVLGFLLFRPRHRSSPSLITESLKK